MSIASRVAQRFIKAEKNTPDFESFGKKAIEGEGEEEKTEGDEDKEEGEEEEEGSFGGSGKFVLPDDHKAAESVPAGGSCCANCKFLSEDICTEPNYVAWNGGDDAIGGPPDQFCSDWWQAGESEESEESEEEAGESEEPEEELEEFASED